MPGGGRLFSLGGGRPRVTDTAEIITPAANGSLTLVAGVTGKRIVPVWFALWFKMDASPGDIMQIGLGGSNAGMQSPFAEVVLLKAIFSTYSPGTAVDDGFYFWHFGEQHLNTLASGSKLQLSYLDYLGGAGLPETIIYAKVGYYFVDA